MLVALPFGNTLHASSSHFSHNFTFCRAIFKAFPKLREGGGIELLVPKKYSSSLQLLNGDGHGLFHGNHLKILTTASSTTYVRPLQVDIKLEVSERG